MDLPRGNLLSPKYRGFVHGSNFFHPMLQPLSPDPRIFPDLHHGYDIMRLVRIGCLQAKRPLWGQCTRLTSDPQMILFVATRIFFPSSFIAGRPTKTSGNDWQPLFLEPSSYLTVVGAFTAQHCFVPPYVRTLPPKQMMCKSIVWTLISLCLWMFVVHSGIPCSVRNNIATTVSKYQSPTNNHCQDPLQQT